MNINQLFADIATDCLTMVRADSFYSAARGLTVRQTFYAYPDDTHVCLSCADGTSTVLTLDADDVACLYAH
jgi:hypothetical protein